MIHRVLSVLVVMGIAASASAQIPNPSFENWTNGFPDGWYTTNIPGFVTPVTAVQPGAAGNFALQGEVVTFAGLGSFPPFVQAIFPVAERPAALTGSYMFSPVGGDSLFIDVAFYSQSLLSSYGFGALVPPPTGSSFQAFSVPIQYFDQTSIPDTCLIQITIYGEDTVHVGSRMVIDNLAFSGTATAVGEEREVPGAFALEQNYPNPFNPATNIRYTLTAAGRATLTVSNLLGETVATVVDADQPAGTYEVRFDAAAIPSGLYFYTLRSGVFTETRRMMLLR
jgi:hypothetical protein